MLLYHYIAENSDYIVKTQEVGISYSTFNN